MSKNFFNRYVWLIDTIQRYGYITFLEISDLWQKSVLNEDGSPLPVRTFFNHREAILDIFGIEIRFDKSRGYYMVHDGFNADGIRDWLLTSLSVNNLLNESSGLHTRIAFEKVPSGSKHLGTVINAMKESRTLEMTYRKFNDCEARTFDAEPWGLKVFKQRWYLVARPENADKPYIYALDRTESMLPTSRHFRLPENFDTAVYFADYFGICCDGKLPVQEILLKVWDRQRHYFRTLPLHGTQQEIEKHEDWSIFKYRMAHTDDLEQDLLQYNDQVEVLAPQSLRDMMIEHAWNLLHLYREA